MENFVPGFKSSSEEEIEKIEEQASLKSRKQKRKREWIRCETYPNKKDAIAGKLFLGYQTARSQAVRSLTVRSTNI